MSSTFPDWYAKGPSGSERWSPWALIGWVDGMTLARVSVADTEVADDAAVVASRIEVGVAAAVRPSGLGLRRSRHPARAPLLRLPKTQASRTTRTA